jgi:hypothetical protein
MAGAAVFLWSGKARVERDVTGAASPGWAGRSMAGRGSLGWVGQFGAPPGPSGAVQGRTGWSEAGVGQGWGASVRRRWQCDARDREAGERKGGAGYYTRLCSSGRHIS